jgi:FkbM family methyltransferase
MIQYLIARKLHIEKLMRYTSVKFRCSCGYLFYARLDDYWRFINQQGHFEPLATSFLIKTIRDDDIILDVGAHIGIHTVHLAKRARLVIAIEPEPSNLSFLVKNIRINNVHEKVVVIPAAACDYDGAARLYIHHSSGGHSFVPMGSSNYIEVRCLKLDSLLKGLGIDRVDVVKIDVEGYELNVLRGFMKFLSRRPPRILIIETELKPFIIDFIRRRYGYKKVLILDCWGLRGNVAFVR